MTFEPREAWDHERASVTDASTGSVQSPTDAAHAVDLATWLEDMTLDDIADYLVALPLPRRTDVFGYLRLDVQAALARTMGRDALAAIVTGMSADDRVDLCQSLPPELRQQLMQGLGKEEREDIGHLAAYAEKTAGALMTSSYATLDAGMSVGEAIAALRREAPDKETIYRSYLLDADGWLIGSVRLHALVLASVRTRVGDVADAAPVFIAVDAAQEDAAKMIARYDLLALPVVDTDGRSVGIVTHDDATDAMQAETTEDIRKMSTVLPFTRGVRDAGIGVLYSKRIVWLALLIFGNLFSGAGIAYFEETILAHVSLVFFLPLLIDSSGNAGSQSATLMVRALATGEVRPKDWRALILREAGVAAALGVTMALVVAPIGFARGGPGIARRRRLDDARRGDRRRPGRHDAAVPPHPLAPRPGDGERAARNDAFRQRRRGRLFLDGLARPDALTQVLSDRRADQYIASRFAQNRLRHAADKRAVQ